MIWKALNHILLSLRLSLLNVKNPIKCFGSFLFSHSLDRGYLLAITFIMIVTIFSIYF